MKKRVILYHLMGWLLWVGYKAAGAFLYNKAALSTNTLLLQVPVVICTVLVFYYCYLLLFPLFLKLGRILWLIVGLLLSPFLFTCLRFCIEALLWLAMPDLHGQTGSMTNVAYWTDNIYCCLPAVIVSAAIWRAQYAFEQQLDQAAALAAKQQAELTRLQMVDLQREIAHIENYIELHRLRTPGNFFADLKVDGDIEGNLIAMDALLTFVENAFEHGVTNDARRPVRIVLRVMGNRLMYTVSNRAGYSSPGALKIQDIAQRLALVYSNRHELLIAGNGQTHKITLNITL